MPFEPTREKEENFEIAMEWSEEVQQQFKTSRWGPESYLCRRANDDKSSSWGTGKCKKFDACANVSARSKALYSPCGPNSGDNK